MNVRGMFIKSLLFFSLTFISFSASALYLGNPNRPNTVWVPGHYVHGCCWVDGYYMKYMNPPVSPEEVVWVEPYHGRQGHWMPREYVIVNSDM